ncbi:MAG: hypothetical protein JWN60_1833 [Acidobacteria bacterium]|nr:hypothetical protein [Acidobacteriota bacterium]
MLETNRLRGSHEEVWCGLDQINAWQQEIEAKEERIKLLIRENNQKLQKTHEAAA